MEVLKNLAGNEAILVILVGLVLGAIGNSIKKKMYSMFRELAELLDALADGLQDDGKYDKNELKRIKKEASEVYGVIFGKTGGEKKKKTEPTDK